MYSYNNLTPATPPRRTGPRMRLTPATTPFLATPSKINRNNNNIPRASEKVTPSTTGRSLRGGCNDNNNITCYHRIGGTPVQSSTSKRKKSLLLLSSSTTRQQQSSFYNNNTPSKTPLSNDNNDADDRFIPSRRHLNMDLCRRALLTGEKRSHSNVSNSSSDDPSTGNGTSSSSATTTTTQETPLQKEFKRRMLSTLCNIPLDKLDADGRPTGIFTYGGGNATRQTLISSYSNNLSENIAPMVVNPFSLDTIRSMKVGGGIENSSADNDPMGSGLSSVASKALRKVPNAPIRILDAPDIVDDYYLNLISWSKDNVLAVALARSVYLWNASSGDIHHLITVQGVDYVTSVSWCTIPGQTKYIAVGTHLNSVHIFDGQALVKVRTMEGATGRIASLSWNNNHNFLSAGDRDACIINHDIRTVNAVVSKYRGHVQEVCGLKWNDDGSCLASGGNENYLCLWDVAMSNNRSSNNSTNRNIFPSGSLEHSPRLVMKQHKAAVKALDWCPFHRGLLASGGGTADRSIKFWNSSSGVMLNTIDTGSQVCSLLWSKHHRELCSSHGYSENQLILWKYPSMTKIKELTGHTARVLNMDMSPDGASVVSAGADETLRFWNLFDTPHQRHTAGGMMPFFSDLSFGRPTIR